MKVGILTHALTTNYGGILQNFALQVVLREKGFNPVTMDYESYTPFYIKVISVCSRLLKHLLGGKMPIRGWVTADEYAVIAQHTRSFVDHNINLSRRVKLSNLGKLRNEKFDALIVGSDQVWRGKRPFIEKFYFSDFINHNIPKIAYAASFGIGDWNYSQRETNKCAKLCSAFRAVSVRENDGIILCKKYLNTKAELVLDPTLLINPSYYLSFVDKKYKINNKSLMVYILDRNSTKNQIVDYISKSFDLSIKSVMAKSNYSDVGSKHLVDCIFPPIEEWLSGFHYSDFVVTDSFHGTVFSIIFNKPFVSIVNKERGTSRFTSLLGMLGLENRLVSSLDEAKTIMNLPIDYSKVNDILREKREYSIDFIIRNLK